MADRSMHEHEIQPPFAHQFDDLEQQHESTNLGMWVFLVTEVMFFGGLFMAYLVYRMMFPHAFAEASHHLDIFWGGLNTVILLSSSLTMALAVSASQEGNNKVTAFFLLLTLVLGAAFLGIKGIEYTHKFHEHLIPGSGFHMEGAKDMHVQMFFCLYFLMTGMHAVHMVIGAGALITLIVMCMSNRFSRDYHSPVELTGLYWHFVDIIWIFLFPLLYLIGRHA